MNKTYIGDGIYLEVMRPNEIILTCDNGIKEYECIVLDYNMLTAIYNRTKILLDLQERQASIHAKEP